MPAKASASSSRAVADGDGEADEAAADGEQHALDQRLRDDLRGARRPAPAAPPSGRAARRRAPAAGWRRWRRRSAARARTRRAGCAGCGRTARCMMPTPPPAGTTAIACCGRSWITLGHPVGRIAGIVLHPLPQHAGQPRRHAVDRRARAQPADHAQPRRDRLAQQRRLAGDQRLLLQRHPQVRRVAAQRFAEEARRRDADDGERVPFDDERGADRPSGRRRRSPVQA